MTGIKEAIEAELNRASNFMSLPTALFSVLGISTKKSRYPQDTIFFYYITDI